MLYWPKRRNSDSSLYHDARRAISDAVGQMPGVIYDSLDMCELFSKNSNTRLYYPVFAGSSGWWGELLGCGETHAPRVVGNLILSAECQLMIIESGAARPTAGAKRGLFAAEIYPTAEFFKKMSSSVATVNDMLATESGTILALFSGKNQAKFANLIESSGNQYLGCIGYY